MVDVPKRALRALGSPEAIEKCREWLRAAVADTGSQGALAAAIGVRQQTVWSWLNIQMLVPAEFCPAIETATEGRVPRSRLRPDIYPAKEAASALSPIPTNGDAPDVRSQREDARGGP